MIHRSLVWTKSIIFHWKFHVQVVYLQYYSLNFIISLLLSYSSSQVVASLYLMANNHHYNTNVIHVGKFQNMKRKQRISTFFYNYVIYFRKSLYNIQACFNWLLFWWRLSGSGWSNFSHEKLQYTNTHIFHYQQDWYEV